MPVCRKGINILRPEEVKAFIAEQKWQVHSKASCAAYYGIFAKYMHLQYTAPRYRYSQKIPFIPTEQEIDCLIAGTGKKTSLFLRILKETGARVNEVIRLQWEDVDLAGGTITINAPEKNGLPRRLPISPTLVTLLNKELRDTKKVIDRSSVSVKSNFTQQRNRLAKKLCNPRLKQIHMHTFRHFYATMLYARTLNILRVQQALGHKSLHSTQLYTHLINFRNDEYDVQTAETVDEAKKLGEAGFEHYDTIDGVHMYRKRK